MFEHFLNQINEAMPPGEPTRPERDAEIERRRTEQERAAFFRGYDARGGFLRLMMTGRCRTGSDQTGRRVHAVRADAPAEGQRPRWPMWGRALCGATPKTGGNGWGEYPEPAVTCPRCLATIATA